MSLWTRNGAIAPALPARAVRASLSILAAAFMLPTLAADPAAAPSPPAKSTAAPAKPAGAAPGAEKAPDPKSQGSYSLGLAFGSQLHNDGLTAEALSFERFNEGFKQALSGKGHAEQADILHIQTLLAASRVKLADSNGAAAKKFLDANGKQPGVTTTASGLQYKVVTEGSGSSPKPTDEVKVHYRGTLLDGTEFDSSYKRGEPATFPVGGVIKGWTEALEMMKPGAKWQLFIPPDLAYGPSGRPGIPPNALLKFDVELISVTTPPATKPAPGAAGQPGATH